jgi:hypothetical protein
MGLVAPGAHARQLVMPFVGAYVAAAHCAKPAVKFP